jgi:hypothetical protein
VREREKRARPRVWLVNNKQRYSRRFSRVHDSRFFIVVVVVVIHLEVNHECHQQSPTAGHFDHTIVIIVGILIQYSTTISYRETKESLVNNISTIPYLFFLANNPFLSISMLRRKKTYISYTISRTNFYDWLYTSKKFDIRYFITSSFNYIDSKSSKDKYKDDNNNNNTNNNNIIFNSNNNINKINEKTSSTWWNVINLCVLCFIES